MAEFATICNPYHLTKVVAFVEQYVAVYQKLFKVFGFPVRIDLPMLLQVKLNSSIFSPLKMYVKKMHAC